MIEFFKDWRISLLMHALIENKATIKTEKKRTRI